MGLVLIFDGSSTSCTIPGGRSHVKNLPISHHRGFPGKSAQVYPTQFRRLPCTSICTYTDMYICAHFMYYI